MENVKSQIIESLKESGIQKGDVALVQSDATAVMSLGSFESWEDALDLLTSCFFEVLGPTGTLIVPTFNWDFCSGKAFDYEASPSQVGIFSNHVLFHCNSVRSMNPILSFASIGPHTQMLFKDLGNSCYGKNSVYQRLHAIDATFTFFNIYMRQANFVHYIEQKKDVDYRVIKKFTGQLRQSGREWEDTYDLYVRKDALKVSTDLRRFEKRMYELHNAKEVWIDETYPVVTAKASDMHDVAFQMLENDPHCFYSTGPMSEVKMNMKQEQSWNKKRKKRGL